MTNAAIVAACVIRDTEPAASAAVVAANTVARLAKHASNADKKLKKQHKT
jgi:hypothetical protein